MPVEEREGSPREPMGDPTEELEALVAEYVLASGPVGRSGKLPGAAELQRLASLR